MLAAALRGCRVENRTVLELAGEVDFDAIAFFCLCHGKCPFRESGKRNMPHPKRSGAALSMKLRKMPSSSDEHHQADGHHRHPGHQAVNRVMMLAVLVGGRQQAVEGDKNHDPGDAGENQAEEHVGRT